MSNQKLTHTSALPASPNNVRYELSHSHRIKMDITET